MRVWLALHELARSRPEVAGFLDVARERERAAVADVEGLILDPNDLDLVLATADGLRCALCRPQSGISMLEAHSTLTNLLTHLEARAEAPPRSA